MANSESSYNNLAEQLKLLQSDLQARKLKEFKRRVSLGDLLTDRRENALQYGFGEGTTCYDNVLILGDVRVGRNTWIGPNVILDGSGPGLSIGDNCAISAGTQIYTHNTVRRTITGGEAPIEFAATTLGNNVYVGPNSIISMGVSIGSSSIIGAMSFVNSDVPSRVKVFGCPAKIVGIVEL